MEFKKVNWIIAGGIVLFFALVVLWHYREEPEIHPQTGHEMGSERRVSWEAGARADWERFVSGASRDFYIWTNYEGCMNSIVSILNETRGSIIDASPPYGYGEYSKEAKRIIPYSRRVAIYAPHSGEEITVYCGEEYASVAKDKISKSYVSYLDSIYVAEAREGQGEISLRSFTEVYFTGHY